MDEQEHHPRLTDARSENLGSDLPAKSGLLKPKAGYSSKKDTSVQEYLAEFRKRNPRTAGKRRAQPFGKKDLPFSKDRTLGPVLSSDLLPSSVEDGSVEIDRLSQSAAPQPGSKQHERASLSKSHSPRHATRTHPLDLPISIVVWNTDGIAHEVEIKRNATVSELKQHVQAKTGIGPDHMDLKYGTRILGGLYGASSEDDYLSNYNIRDGRHLDVQNTWPKRCFTGLKPVSNTRYHQVQHQAEAESADFDEDLHIVDPQSHYDMLGRLERDVVQHSEYFRTKREYSLSSAVGPPDDEGVFLDDLGLPASLQRKIHRSSTVGKTLGDQDPSSGTLWQLLRSYAIILNVLRSSRQMRGQHFCKDAVNILIAHERVDVIEIRRIPLEMITNIARALEATIDQFLETDLKETSLALNIRVFVLTPCRRLFDQVGRHIPASDGSSDSELLAMVRAVASLLDVALISYVRSHGSGFDSSYFGQDLEQLEVNYGHRMGFRCYWTKLACLHSFLDQKRVWTFDFLDKRSDNSRPRGKRSGSSLLLARMEDLADIWGPVYNVPTETGLIEYYRVSKGVICRVKSRKKSPIPGATLCHYFSNLSFYELEARRLGIAMNDLALSKDDLLLIGAGFRENQHCRYTISAFTKESASRMTVLGTKESVWRTDNRTLAFSLSKNFGVTISGTQKLIPQTTLKQHILDKWTTKPTRSNPAILNQYLGVEISHCTGNARRVSLKELMVSNSMWPVLQCQHPGWHETPWGTGLNTALHNLEHGAIIKVWQEYPFQRSEMAELVCRMLELLDGTGWDERKVFSSAVLDNNQERAIQIPKELNTWLVAVQDTHLTSAYVITTETCIECEVADHMTSLCGMTQAFTALETQITAIESPSAAKMEYLLQPSGERFRRLDCESPEIVLLTPMLRTILRVRFRTRTQECFEILNRRIDYPRSAVYLRASVRSCRGRYEIKDTLLSKFSSFLTPNRDSSNIDRMSAVSLRDKDSEGPKYAGGRRDQHNGHQLLSEERTPTSCDLIGNSGSHCVTGESTLSMCGTTIEAAITNRQAKLQESNGPHHITDIGADERMPARGPDAIGKRTRRRITNSDLQSRNNDIKYGEMHRLTTRRSNIATANSHEPSWMRGRPTQRKVRELQNNLAKYSIADDDEPGTDDSSTFWWADQMPAIVGHPSR